MTARHKPEVLIARDEIVAAPALRACDDQSFELPGRLYVAMATMFVGFIAVLAFSFRGSHMAVAYGVIFAFLGAYFAIPAIFPQMKPEGRTKALSWAVFRYKGIQTATGRATATEATVLVLLLPFLILCFGIAIATIASLV
ncbi:MAG TPA: hypothetical protein VFW39_05800 [Sphingomicrobium sp.]|nr:hypothetical protein [Sphingomicrobium sp.]